MIAARVCSLHSTKNERSNLPGNIPGNNNGQIAPHPRGGAAR
jgi:hypothetical protein